MALSSQMISPSLSSNSHSIGWWRARGAVPQQGVAAFKNALLAVRQPIYVVQKDNDVAVSHEGSLVVGPESVSDQHALPMTAYCPPLPPQLLGDAAFKAAYGLEFAYLLGSMANGISSVDLVAAAGHHGLLSFFGAGGLALTKIDAAIGHLQDSQRRRFFPFGINLIHTPADATFEMETVQLYLKRRIDLVSASAFMNVTLPVTYFRVKGLYKDNSGKTVCPNRIIAKISREEVARQFLSPPPRKHIDQLLADGRITTEEAELAQSIPVADDITAEADSGGHTDNRPALALLPTITALRDEMAQQYKYHRLPSVGLAGGIATPASTAAAFAMGAGFVLTGSVNQGCLEAGTSPATQQMLAEAHQADVMMAPSADMFELGVDVQVLKRGTLFPMRARKLYDLYNRHDCYADLSQEDRQWIETDLFRRSFEEEWQATQTFFNSRDPRQLKRAEKSPKHKMALVFRSYLGQSSHWANTGAADRRLDYQIWCGPGMGAFNEWTQGSFLESVENRRITTVAANFLFGAAVINRYQLLRQQGVPLAPSLGRYQPHRLDQIEHYLDYQS